MNSISRCKPLLGTYVEVSIEAEENDSRLLEMSAAAFAEIEKIHHLMSFHDPESELSKLNRHAYSAPYAVSAEMLEILSQALELSRLTNGLYDVSIAPSLIQIGHLPDHGYTTCEDANWQDISIYQDAIKFEKALALDLGGIAKGYAVDQAIALFNDEARVVINAGGDLRMTHWQEQQIGIRYRVNDGVSIVEVPMLAGAVATSADYYMDGMGAIVCPETKEVMRTCSSYSVFADTCMLADALTKVAFLSEDIDLIETLGARLIITEQYGALKGL
ncbi:MAG: FAD:protein FMN transferase [Pseudomonadota bacterium]